MMSVRTIFILAIAPALAEAQREEQPTSAVVEYPGGAGLIVDVLYADESNAMLSVRPAHQYGGWEKDWIGFEADGEPLGLGLLLSEVLSMTDKDFAQLLHIKEV